MTTQPRRGADNPALREQILDAARRLFVKEGYHKVSMRRIAGDIGYSPTTIYLHFKNKGELFHCLIEEMLVKVLRRLESIRSEGLGPVDTLKKMLHAYVQLGLEDPNRYRVGFMLETDLRRRPEDYLPEESLARQVFDIFAEGVRNCLREEEPQPRTVDLAVQAVWAPVHGLTALLVTYPTFGWVDRELLAAKVIDSAVAGIMH